MFKVHRILKVPIDLVGNLFSGNKNTFLKFVHFFLDYLINAGTDPEIINEEGGR